MPMPLLSPLLVLSLLSVNPSADEETRCEASVNCMGLGSGREALADEVADVDF